MTNRRSGNGKAAPTHANNADRFVYLLDPLGNWVVWDCRDGLPAMRNGTILTASSRAEAAAATAALNARERRGSSEGQ